MNDVDIERNYSPASTGPGESCGLQTQSFTNIKLTDVTLIDNYNVEGGQLDLYVPGENCNQPLIATISGLKSITDSRFNNDYTMGVEICGTKVTLASPTILTVADSALAFDADSASISVAGGTISSTATGSDPAGYPSAALLFGDTGSLTLSGIDITGSNKGLSFVGCPITGRILITGVNAYGVPTPVAGSCYQSVLGSGLLTVSNSPGL